MDLNLKMKQITFRSVFIHMMLGTCMVLLSGQIFAGQELSSSAYQSRTVRGIVTDDSGDPLPGVNVVIKGTTTGVTTGADGSYSITVSDNAVLMFSFLGYLKYEIPVGIQTEINLTMVEDAQQIKEVVVVGYGTQSVKKVTTAITKLDTEVLKYVPYTNVASSLQGNIPGLRVLNLSGEPGAAPRVILRGGASIANPAGAAPLYIVDGVMRGIGDIPGADIESVQVLKDAASTAIYGARASNGVVIVTTKKGKPGKFNINYSYGITTQKAQRLVEYVDAREYIYQARWSLDEATRVKPERAAQALDRLNGPYSHGIGNDLTKNTAHTTQYLQDDPAKDNYNAHKLQEGWESMIDPVDPSKTIIFKETNFRDLTFQRATLQSHNISASGGNERFNFYSSLGYFQGQGITISSDYQRYNFITNASAKITDRLKVDAGIMYSETRSNNSIRAYDAAFYRSTGLPATTKYEFEDGTLAPGVSQTHGNPHYYLTGPGALKRNNVAENLTAHIAVRWDILPGLYFEPQLSTAKAWSKSNSFQPAFWNGVSTYVDTRESSSALYSNSVYQADAVFTYAKSILHHSLEAKAGYAYYYRYSTNYSITGQGAATDHILTPNASTSYTSVSGNETGMALSGFFGRLNYDYDAKYLLSFNLRYDGSSTFGSSKRYGFFPGVSVGWNLDRESFWNNLFPDYLFELKLRGSYGITGNIGSLGDYQWQGVYGASRYAGQSAITVAELPNSSLHWEQSKTLDLGFDANLWRRRISLSFDYFKRTTEYLLTTLTLPYSTGFGSIYTNFGTLLNKGVEMAVSVSVLPEVSKLRWEIALNAAYVDTKILKLPNNGIEKNRQGGTRVYDTKTKDYIWIECLQEGGRIGDMKSLHQLGVYATDADAVGAPRQMVGGNSLTDKSKVGGDVIWEDKNGDGEITMEDYQYAGNAYPDWTGGFSTSLRYMGFTFVARFDYTLGHTIENYAKSFADGQLQGDVMPTKDYISKMWKKQGDITDTPRYWWGNMMGNADASSRYFEKGDFLCLREVSLNYTLPASLASRLRVQDISLTVSGSNLYYFTHYKGVVPEVGGRDLGVYPIPRNINFGINVTF